MKIPIKLDKYVIIYTVIFLGIIPYDLSKLIPTLFSNIIIYFIRLCICFYALCLFRKKNKIDYNKYRLIKQTTFYFFSIFVINFLSVLTHFSEISILTVFERLISMFCVYSTLIITIFNLDNIQNILNGIKCSTTILVLLSLILFLFYPNIGKYYAGNGEYTFLGIAFNRNGYIEFALLLLISNFALKPSKIKLFDIILIFITLITIYLTGSATAIVITLLVIVFIFFKRFLKFEINTKLIIKIIFAFWVIFLIFSINFDFSFISSIFNKTSTLSGRTILWERTIDYIKKRPLMGYSYDNSVIKNTYSPLYYNYFKTNDPHNAILYLMLSSGILGTICTVCYILVLLSSKKIFLQEKNKYLILYIIAFLIRGMVESCLHYSHVLFYIVLILLNGDDKKKEENKLYEQ